MHALRWWILGVAVGSFAAGMVVGHTFTHASDGIETPDVEDARNLAERYGLSAEQHRQARLVLQFSREKEIAILRSAAFDQLPPAQMAQLRVLRNATEQRLRKLLDDEQRARYDRDSRPDPGPAVLEKLVEKR